MAVSPVGGSSQLYYQYLNQPLKAASEAGKTDLSSPQRCETCSKRAYKDGSDDPTVSYQTPTHISPEQAAGAVAAHEQEHVRHEQARAAENGARVVSQTVVIHTAICPECGRVYVSGGETKTVTQSDKSQDLSQSDPQNGSVVNIFA
jgi:hypothetical protein